MRSIEKLSPVNGDCFTICAASLLCGHALIVGGGRGVGIIAAVLNDRVESIGVIEPEKEMLRLCESVRNQPPLASGVTAKPVTLFHCSVANFESTRLYDSIFFDPYPWTLDALAGSRKVYDWLKERGRLVFLEDTTSQAEFGGPWVDEDSESIRPANYYRKRKGGFVRALVKQVEATDG